MKNLIKRLARMIFRDYSVYDMYGHKCTAEISLVDVGFRFESVDENAITNSGYGIIVEQAGYHGEFTYAYACLKDSHIVGLCFFWYGERYKERNFWPLEEGEAKLVQLVVIPEMRGRGIARSLIKFATKEMCQQGFEYLYARIWWSNTPSLRAFEHAGWTRIATVIEIYLRNRTKPFRLKLMREHR